MNRFLSRLVRSFIVLGIAGSLSHCMLMDASEQQALLRERCGGVGQVNAVSEKDVDATATDAHLAFNCFHAELSQQPAIMVPAPGETDAGLTAVTFPSQVRRDADPTWNPITAVGELATLNDPRFSLTNAKNGLWRSYDFIIQSRPGVYFLEPYDAAKTPVLFIHGINGSPLNFEYLIRQLDRTRFQPWVYSYPSGMHLAAIADHLTQIMVRLETQHHFARFAIVAHSMGGLVARGFLLRHAKNSGAEASVFATISTPWAGHEGAQFGVKHAPVVVDAWRDLAPGSRYIGSLFSEQLPAQTRHFLFFSFARNAASFGASGDRTVTVASQLAKAAQQQAAGIYGIDATHDGVLRSDYAAGLLNRLLANAY
jgi:pimeloyl-ACP methyl ester carboxylesterase